MREKDIRDRINAFLRTKLQNLVVPASMGIGLALGACDTSSLSANPDGSADASAIRPGSGGAGGGLTGAGGTVYGIGGSYRPISGGAGGGAGGLYGQAGFPNPGSGGSAGSGSGLGGTMGTVYGIGGSYRPSSGGAGGGLTGTGGTVYGTGGFKDAGPSGGGGVIDSGEIPEAGKSEVGQSSDSMSSEAGVVDSLPGQRF